MIQMILLMLVLLLPITTEAAYKIYFKDGTVISGVEYYEKKGNDVDLFFEHGSMLVPEKDILKIEGKESAGTFIPQEDTKETTDDTSVTSTREASDRTDTIARLKALQDDVDALNEEIRAVNIKEAQLVTTINQKRNETTVWNKYQVMQLENELKPLSDELHAIQQKKIELLERKGSLEAEISELRR